ncbi:hypothetical protein pclt_cds_1062 [Pandoravirus celtis]|uniref:Uncharacterized protein n=1 Tax=Pandoravirus celtis TaxID=2568002 RepID=A0A4D6EIH6_9VIRU|nr:hypothetical protein pclt_cds_1062 [Pandoravirus celtis]
MDPAKTPRAPTREEQVEDLLRRLSPSCWTSPRDREDAIYALRTHTYAVAAFFPILFYYWLYPVILLSPVFFDMHRSLRLSFFFVVGRHRMSDAIMTSIREALARSDADRPCDLKRKKQD